MSEPTTTHRRLEAWLDPLTVRTRQPEIAWLAAVHGMDGPPEVAAAALVGAIERSVAERSVIRKRSDGLRSAAAQLDGAPLQGLLRRHIEQTVTDGWERWRDLRALDRWLDLDALLEREAERSDAIGARIEVALKLVLGVIDDTGGAIGPSDPATPPISPEIRAVRRAAGVVTPAPVSRVGAPPRTAAHLLTESGLQPVLIDRVLHEERAATRRVAVRVLALTTAAALQTPDGGNIVEAEALRVLRALLADDEADPWLRRPAVLAARGLQGSVARRWLSHLTSLEQGREPFLVRAAAMEVALDRPERWANDIARARMEDPSELVRQTMVVGLARRVSTGDAGARSLLALMMASDPEPRVRARAADALGGAGDLGVDLLAGCLGDEPLVAGAAVETAMALVDAGVEIPDVVVEALERARRGSPATISRRAALVLLSVRLRNRPEWALALDLQRMETGQRRLVKLPDDVDALALSEALVPAAATGDGFTLDLQPDGWVWVTRGDVLRPVVWRALHELRNPSPIKRQGFDHTLGRIDVGSVRVPPRGLCEEAPTGVPGQRVRAEQEDGWAPELPQVDDYLHATSRGTVTIVTAEGVTVVEAPATRLDRLRARMRVIWRYARLDHLRQVGLSAGGAARTRRAYVREMDSLGFRTVHTGVGPWHGWFRVVIDPVSYLLTLGANGLGHLAVSMAALTALLLAQQSLARSRIERYRRAIPLVIGGWGTRGKSGTERLKAGMFHGLGIPYVAKTTGCEAMVLLSRPAGPAVEVFLFRPFDKATIWEQASVMQLVPDRSARLLLWECMALRESYVDILQRWWTRDDLSTITNTYPDHEDIQGPTGMDVAEVIAGFSPWDATVFTSEENMLPVVDRVARSHGSTVRSVRKADRDLVPGDLMSRMPHAEHRSNVALVAELAAHFGVDSVDAIGMMADNVVPDLGALAVFPRASRLGRDVEFVNGMSANDELSFRHNWRYTGFGDHDHLADPDVWLVTVVNNRADRVPRSVVFARICADVAAAHRHVVVGTNVRGFHGYYMEAARARINATDTSDPIALQALLNHFRIVDPVSLADVCGGRLDANAEVRRGFHDAVGELGDVVVTRLADARAQAERVRAVAAAVQAACSRPADGLADALIDALARFLLARGLLGSRPDQVVPGLIDLFEANLVVVDDAGIAGADLIDLVLQQCPPGALVRMMGIQNIKGTGLDFVYNWVEWRDLTRAIRGLSARDPVRRRASLEEIAAQPLRSAMACDAAADAVTPVLDDPSLRGLATAVARTIELKRASLAAGPQRSALRDALRPFLSIIERLLDPIDAVLRRWKADRVMADLRSRRVSLPRAQQLLQALTKRQKGGWLSG
jgi:poly-gamma-glutamate synthase PgsB/CapB